MKHAEIVVNYLQKGWSVSEYYDDTKEKFIYQLYRHKNEFVSITKTNFLKLKSDGWLKYEGDGTYTYQHQT